MLSAHATASELTPDSEWQPDPAVLAALKYGGDIGEAVRQQDHEALAMIMEVWQIGALTAAGPLVGGTSCLQTSGHESPRPPMGATGAGSSFAPPPPPPPPPLVARSDSNIARELQDEEAARALALQFQEEQAREANFECGICAERKPYDGSYSDRCENRTCGDCVFQRITSKLEEGQYDESQLTCAFCTEPLPHPLVVQSLRMYGRDDLRLEFEKERLAACVRRGPFCSCPQCKHMHFLSAADAADGIRATCLSCAHPFCSKCAAPRYHYFHAGERDPPDCAALMRQKQAAWLQWRAEGQAAYLRQLAQVDAEYAERLQGFESEAAGKRAAYAAFEADEAAKAGWVHCPHCGVLWAGSDACPEVTCGVLEQAMGQRRASVGCGRQFNLQRDGRPYQPVRAPPLQAEAARPEAPAAVVHEHVACDKCGETIRGVRIRCMHCPHYNLCLPCLAESGPEHDAEESEWPGRDQAPHVFEVLHRPVPP